MVSRSLSLAVVQGVVAAGLASGGPEPATAQPVTLSPPPGSSAVVTAEPLAPPAAAQAETSPAVTPSSHTMSEAQAQLGAARSAYESGRVAEARDALGRAEADLLAQLAGNRSPETERAILDIGVARQAVQRGDPQAVLRAIDDAMTSLPPPPQVPTVTYALLPGHWALEGWKYVWVPPETVPRRVEYRPFVLGHYLWRDGEWTWVPSHYASNGG